MLGSRAPGPTLDLHDYRTTCPASHTDDSAFEYSPHLSVLAQPGTATLLSARPAGICYSCIVNLNIARFAQSTRFLRFARPRNSPSRSPSNPFAGLVWTPSSFSRTF